MLSQLSLACSQARGVPKARLLAAASVKCKAKQAPELVKRSAGLRHSWTRKWARSSRPVSGLQVRVYTVEATPLDSHPSKESLKLAREERDRAMRAERFKTRVNRFGKSKPELERLIDDFTINFLQFVDFKSILYTFGSPNRTQELLDRYKRPLKPLEYYFTETQLQEIFTQRLARDLSTEVPNKAEVLNHIQSDTFLRQLKEKFGAEEAATRRDSYLEYIRKFTDDELRLRSLTTMDKLLENHPLSKTPVNGPLDEELLRLRSEGKLKDGEVTAFYEALKDPQRVPLPTPAEEMSAKLMAEYDKLQLFTTPEPEPSAPLPYYERLRLQGKSLNSSKRRLLGGAPPRSPAERAAANSNFEAPAVYPFTAKAGYMGNNIYANPIEYSQTLQTEKEAFQNSTSLTPQVRQWTPMQREHLKKFIDYTNEWLAANKMLDGTLDASKLSGIEWAEHRRPELAPEEALRALQHIQPSSEGVPLDATHETLRVLAQMQLATFDLKSPLAPVVEPVVLDHEKLIDEAFAVAQKYGSKSLPAPTTKLNGPEATRALSAFLSKGLRKKHSLQPPRELTSFDLIAPGHPRTANYSVETNLLDESAGSMDPSTHKVHTPVRPLSESELNAYHKLCWLTLKQVAQADTESLLVAFVQGSTSPIKLETIWAARQAAQHLVSATESLYSSINVTDAELEAVATKVSVDYAHLHSFIVDNLVLLGEMESAPNTSSSALHTSSSKASTSLDTSILSESLLASLEPNGKLTEEHRQMILSHVNSQALQAQFKPLSSDTFSVVHNQLVDELKTKGDAAVLDKPVLRRLAKMEPAVRELVASLTGPELRTLFPLDVLHSHPFLTLEQRSRALVPVFLADPQLNQHRLSTDSNTLNTASVRQSYLEKSFPTQIMKLLRNKSLHEGTGGLSSLGTSVERMSRLLDLPPIGLSVSSGEVAQALQRAQETASASESTALASLQASLSEPTVQSLFRTTASSDCNLGAQERLEKLLKEGIPATIPVDSPTYKQLSADLAAYQRAQSAALAQEARNSRSTSLIESIRTRLEKVRHMFPVHELFMVEPKDNDSFDVLLLKQDMVARAEEAWNTDPMDHAIASIPSDINDADIILTKADGSVEKKRWKREDSDETASETKSSKPQSVLFGSENATVGETDFSSPDVPNIEWEALKSELDAMRDLLGLSSKSEYSPSEAREVIKAFVSTITGMDPLQMWEAYPELAPQIPPQAIHGPFRETWDVATARVEHIPAALAHMYEPMKDAMMQWYMDRDADTLMPRLERKANLDDERAIAIATGSNQRLENWISGYAIDMVFPVERTKLFQEVLRFSPRLFRKMDMDRDVAVLQSYQDSAEILEAHETPQERIGWFKEFHRQLAQLADQVRAVIGPHGESYLEYNNFMIQRWLAEHHKDLEGPVAADDVQYLADAVLKSGELDNPDERVLLQVIYTFLQLSFDATELHRLQQVSTTSEYELWAIWKLLRRARHEERANMAQPLDEEARKNAELPFDHPKRRHEADHLDAEEDALFRSRLAEDLEFDAREEAPPALIPKHLGNQSLVEHLANIARRKLPEARQAIEDEKDKAFWQRKDHERLLRKRSAEGFAVDPESRMKEIYEAITAKLPESKLTADPSWFKSALAQLETSLPKHIQLDPLYQKMKQASLLQNEKLSKLANLSLHSQHFPRYANDIADSPAQAQRILTLLNAFPLAQHAYHTHLKRMADLHYGQIETWKLAPNSDSPSSDFDLETYIIKVLSNQAESSGLYEDLLINPREIFPNVNWEPETPQTVTQTSNSPAESTDAPKVSTTGPKPPIQENLSSVDQELHESFYRAVIAEIAPKNPKSQASDTKKADEARERVNWATALTPLERANWAASYKLFAKATMLDKCVSKYKAKNRAEHVVEIEANFSRLLLEVDFTALPSFPQDLNSRKIIPWTLIQRILGYTERQLKTLMLFLTNKQRYLDHPSSLPPNMPNFYWDKDEFNMIRNRFLGVRSHPSGVPTFEETMHDLLFTESALSPSPAAPVVKEEPMKNVASGKAKTTSSHHFKPIDAENVLQRFQSSPSGSSSADRLEWAQEEAKRHPLDTYSKHTLGQLKLAELGIDLSEFRDDRIPGLEKLIPVQKHAISSDSPPSAESDLNDLEKLAKLAKNEENLQSGSKPLLPEHGVVSVEVLGYPEGTRIGDHDKEIGTEMTTTGEESKKKVGTRKDANTGAATTSDGENASDKTSGSEETSSDQKAEGSKAEGEGAQSASKGESEAGGEGAEAQDPDKVDWVQLRREAEVEAKLEAERYVAWEKQLIEQFDEEGEENMLERLAYDSDEALERFAEFVTKPDLQLLHDYNAKSVDTHHLTVNKHLLKRVIMTKWSLLMKQANQLDYLPAFPVHMEYLNIIRAALLNQIELTFWHTVPHKPAHRQALQKQVMESFIVSTKFHRRLMIHMDPLIWGTTHYTPEDSFDELLLGLTNVELYHGQFEKDNPVVFPSPLGKIAPRVELRQLPDPNERFWAEKREEVLERLEKMKFFNRQRKPYFLGLAGALVLGGLGYTAYTFATQDDDTFSDRIAIEASITKTQVLAAADRVGFAASFLASATLNLFKGIAWLFTYSMDRATPEPAFMEDESDGASLALNSVLSTDLQPLVPSHLVREDTGGYHYYKFMQQKSRQERAQEQALLRDAYVLYEQLPHDPALQAEVKATKDRIQDAIRLAQLRQYQKQKSDFAAAVPRQPRLPTMPDWFEMPENRFWDQVPSLRYYAPDAEKFWRRPNWYYHPDDEPVSRMLTPDEHLFGKEAKMTSEGHVMNPGPNPWRQRPVDDL